MYNHSCSAAAPSSPSEQIRRLTFRTEAAQLRLFKILRDVRPFCDRERYLRYLQVRYRFSQFVQPAYSSCSMHYNLPDLDRRSRLAQLVLDITDVTPLPIPQIMKRVPGQQDFGSSTLLGWLLVAEAINSFSPIFLREVRAIGFNETVGARHLGGAPERAHKQWHSLSDAVAMSLNDGMKLSRVASAISSALDCLETLACEAMR